MRGALMTPVRHAPGGVWLSVGGINGGRSWQPHAAAVEAIAEAMWIRMVEDVDAGWPAWRDATPGARKKLRAEAVVALAAAVGVIAEAVDQVVTPSAGDAIREVFRTPEAPR